MKKLTKKQIEFITIAIAIVSCIGTYLALLPGEKWQGFFEFFIPGETFTVRATNWQNTGIHVTSDQKIEIKYISGRWENCVGCPATNASGISDDAYMSSNPSNVIYGCPHGALIARTSDTIDSINLPVGEQDFLSLQNDILCIGNSFIGTFPFSGYIQLASNDRFTFDNSGSIVIRVTIK